MNETEVNIQSTVCQPPNEMNFIDYAEQWLMNLPSDDADKFLHGLSLDAALVLFKNFPDNDLVKQVLQSKL